MSYIRADVNLNGVDELELFVDFEKKLEALKKSKYGGLTSPVMAGQGIGINNAGSILQNTNQP